MDFNCGPKIQSYFDSNQKPKSDRMVPLYAGQNSDFDCGFMSLMLKLEGGNPETIKTTIKETNWDPCCIPTLTQHAIETVNKDQSRKGSVNGFVVGTEAVGGIDLLSGYTGKNIVVIATSDDTLQIGTVNYHGGSAGVSFLPVGINYVQGALYGKCHSIENYLGYFKNVPSIEGGVLGATKSYGVDLHDSSVTKTRFNDCDSLGWSLGPASGISAGVSDYLKSSPYYEIKGARVKELIRVLKTGTDFKTYTNCKKEPERPDKK